MAEEETVTADAGGTTIQIDPNTGRELARARADAKRYREEIQALREDVARIHKENEGFRGRAKQLESELEAAKADRLRFEGQTKTEHEKVLAERDAEAKKRLTYAEVKAEAIKAGIVDVEGLKLLDLSVAELDDAGNVKLPGDFWDKAKEAKSYLFADTKPPVSSTSTAKPPPVEKPGKIDARKMDDAQAAELEARILRGERVAA